MYVCVCISVTSCYNILFLFQLTIVSDKNHSGQPYVNMIRKAGNCVIVGDVLCVCVQYDLRLVDKQLIPFSKEYDLNSARSRLDLRFSIYLKLCSENKAL